MKNINKTILLGGILLASTSMIFAVSEPTPTYTSALSGSKYTMATDSYEVFSSHRAAMGGAGLGVTGFYDSYLYNPANITKDGFKLYMPTLTTSINNVQSLIAPGDDDNGDPQDGLFELYDRYNAGESMDDLSGDLVGLMLNSINSGYGEVATVNVRTGVKFRNFGLNLDIQDKVRSYNFGLGSSTASYLDQLDIVASGALGFNIPINDAFSVDLGAMVAFNYRVYSKGLGVTEALGLMEDFSNETLTQQIPLTAGYSIPITLGANLNMPLDMTLSVVGRNINDTFHYTTYNNFENFMNFDPTMTSLLGTMTHEYTGSDDELAGSINYKPNDASSFDVTNDWQMDVGLTWAPKWKLIKPVIALDFMEANKLFDDVETSDDFTMNLLESAHVGTQLTLLNFLDVRAGLSSGYKSFGAGFDIPFLVHVDAAYYFKEFGTVLGESPSDVFSIKLSLLSAR